MQLHHSISASLYTTPRLRCARRNAFRNCKPLGSYATAEVAVVEAMHAAGAEITIVEDRVKFLGGSSL